MKKTLLIISSCLIVFVAILSFTGCDYLLGRDYQEETTTAPPYGDQVHWEIEERIDNSDFKTSYSELYNIYESVIAHQNEHKCYINIEPLLTNMLYGKWEDSNDNYISYTYKYENYNNTVGKTWYGTSLSTSKISGNTYYYYLEVDGTNLIIGYEDKLTEEKTANFVITFYEDHISVYNKNDQLTYRLELKNNYDKVQEGNARMAYIYIGKNIFDFKNPSSVKVTSCHVDYEEKVVYATIQANNSYGGTVTEDYIIYEIGGQYYMDESYNSYSTNIDLNELNQKLQHYVSTGG